MTRSPATQRIVTAAIAHFAEASYDGASLSAIAEAVGIRKASLYAHFASKEALFMAAFEEALGIERTFADDCFNDESDRALPGLRYCHALIRRFGESAHLRFLLRAGYMPPDTLAEWVDARHEAYLAQLNDRFLARLDDWQGAQGALSAMQRERFALAYLGIVDSLQVKLIYTTAELARERLEALSSIFEDSLIHHCEGGKTP
ncbi:MULTISPECIES: TetR/AcrR family transcriptional regulator [unclassified Halomonas]|uniref:TetR/AcrR family transcriptional regulator n=1 Tax=unclassified Halomonas TaxID=2609666 RepID=UPI0020A02EBA|nr:MULTISPECIES: TetR/AcrR family transcriptional regulator [unclassified Halomonas]MCP1315742.1 TetR/AcrR family transcriptional regulator [Halomonas sp. 707D7]MCP1327393.1 TetR/AcrR family transcriptional regulator [Halomonas sp. 707D4]